MFIGDIAFRNLDDFDPKWLADARGAATTLIVPGNMTATDVAQQMADEHKSLVLVEDPAAPGTTTGIVIPSWIVYRVMERLPTPISVFTAALDALYTAGAATGHFSHEYLTQFRVDPLWCTRGEHYIQRPPCPYHPA